MTTTEIIIAANICFTLAALTFVTGLMSVYINMTDRNIVSRTIIVTSIPLAFLIAGLLINRLLP